jgi:3' terminal RNA ribose 2'-O-methyltransferase Hen1
MLLTMSTSHQPATDLGYLLHKNPSRLQSFDLSFGRAHVFYPEAGAERCTAALLLEVDPVRLVRGGKGRDAEGFGLDQYVNDRPYVASSFLSVAIGEVFGTALSGRSKDRPQLADEKLPLEASVAVVASLGGEDLLKRLFEPLGYEVSASGQPLDPVFPDWGESCYYHLTLKGICRLRDLLTHLSVLIPVLDNEKHYFVGDEEVEKLLRRGEGWLETHPEKTLISTRYLKYRRSLIRVALDRLAESDTPDPDIAEAAHAAEEEAIEKPIRLHDQRLNAVLEAIKESGAARVLDLGCGSGRLLAMLLKDSTFTKILGLDVSFRSLERARDNLRLDRLPERRRERISLIHGSLTYRDRRLEGYDAAVAVEVIEHLDPFRIEMLNRVVFEFACPSLVILTTPNREYNDLFPGLAAGKLRHRDHRFEWTRAEFAHWAAGVAQDHGYEVAFQEIGPQDLERGSPSQMAIFKVKAGE